MKVRPESYGYKGAVIKYDWEGVEGVYILVQNILYPMKKNTTFLVPK